jgi:hypothetical protein
MKKPISPVPRPRIGPKLFVDATVADVFEAYPAQIRTKLLSLRELIFRTAATTVGVGELQESLRWGEPAYLTARSTSGSTIRIGWKKSKPRQYAMYFNCQTTLVETFRRLFPLELKFEGNRAIVFDASDNVPMDSLGFCVAAALTYRRRTGSAA